MFAWRCSDFGPDSLLKIALSGCARMRSVHPLVLAGSKPFQQGADGLRIPFDPSDPCTQFRDGRKLFLSM